ncbi:MAG: hypothetical protein WHX93_18315 [bacterium]
MGRRASWVSLGVRALAVLARNRSGQDSAGAVQVRFHYKGLLHNPLKLACQVIARLPLKRKPSKDNGVVKLAPSITTLSLIKDPGASFR